MNPKETKQMIESSIEKLRTLYWIREDIERDMGKHHLAIRGLLNLIDNNTEKEAYRAVLDNYPVRVGLSDLVLMALSQTDKRLTPSEIRDFIVDYGSESSAQRNLLQSVHTTLKRLKEERVKEEIDDKGQKVYRLMRFGERMLRMLKSSNPYTVNRIGNRMEVMFPTDKLGKIKRDTSED